MKPLRSLRNADSMPERADSMSDVLSGATTNVVSSITDILSS